MSHKYQPPGSAELLDGMVQHPDFINRLIPDDCPPAWSYIIRQCCAHDREGRPAQPFKTIVALLRCLVLDISPSPGDKPPDPAFLALPMVRNRPAITCAGLPGASC